ncbi:glycosyltransferase family 2 protein [Guyparkeria hydrothermalis]|uniref:glycosyltransferase family 2 protein n=1 Tax=Guyparkeria hydrothermalis TaxID=923 RepID=UPI0020210B28|nr:glycosyltransferase family 2 protein [Guyparkeria hydrothermalis]MCL7743801.1 glycosyltransferase family 2 protein [Guyparkeria hydrothermalis]
MKPSINDFRPLILIPCYNPGRRIETTVRDATQADVPIWIVDDGSDEETRRRLAALESDHAELRVIRHETNRGKGAAVLTGIQAALERGYTHALTMDADGQHPAERIPAFIEAARQRPEAMILGRPVFSEDAPALRVQGRKISNFWANLETLWGGIGDSLFGMRVYPFEPLVRVMRQTHWMRRFDFDPEAAVRLVWLGVPAINLDAPVRYFDAQTDGVSHFHYARDNRLLIWMHLRLLAGFLWRLPRLLRRRLRGSNRDTTHG